MANRKRSKEKEDFWRLVFHEFESFDGSVRAYCRRKGLSENSFYSWRKEIARRDLELNSDAEPLVPVRVIEAEPSCATEESIEIRTPGGMVLRLRESVPGDQLSKLVSVLLDAESAVGRC